MEIRIVLYLRFPPLCHCVVYLIHSTLLCGVLPIISMPLSPFLPSMCYTHSVYAIPFLPSCWVHSCHSVCLFSPSASSIYWWHSLLDIVSIVPKPPIVYIPPACYREGGPWYSAHYGWEGEVVCTIVYGRRSLLSPPHIFYLSSHPDLSILSGVSEREREEGRERKEGEERRRGGGEEGGRIPYYAIHLSISVWGKVSIPGTYHQWEEVLYYSVYRSLFYSIHIIL